MVIDLEDMTARFAMLHQPQNWTSCNELEGHKFDKSSRVGTSAGRLVGRNPGKISKPQKTPGPNYARDLN
jgi:hypothetical protein